MTTTVIVWVIDKLVTDIVLSAVDVARECHHWNDGIQMPAVSVFSAVQWEHADQNSAWRNSHDAHQQQKHTPPTNWADGGWLYLLLQSIS